MAKGGNTLASDIAQACEQERRRRLEVPPPVDNSIRFKNVAFTSAIGLCFVLSVAYIAFAIA